MKNPPVYCQETFRAYSIPHVAGLAIQSLNTSLSVNLFQRRRARSYNFNNA